jgi:hypothetical protein
LVETANWIRQSDTTTMDTVPTEQETASDDTHTMQNQVFVTAPPPPMRIGWSESPNPAVRRAISELVWESDICENVAGTFRDDLVDYVLSQHNTRLPQEIPMCSLAPKWSRYRAGYLAYTVWFLCVAYGTSYIEETNVAVHELPNDMQLTPRNAIPYLFNLYKAKIQRTMPLVDEINRELRRRVQGI